MCVIKLCMGRFFWCMVLNNSLLDLVCSMFVCMFTRICLQGVCVCESGASKSFVSFVYFVCACMFVHSRKTRLELAKTCN